MLAAAVLVIILVVAQMLADQVVAVLVQGMALL
jgi:hypothetical protein